MSRPYFRTEGLACFAHRGGAALWPENTMEAFRGGFEAGCGWIETDVHMTRDGHIVCFHDHELERTTNGRGKVWEYSLAELRRLDAGYHFTPDGHSFPFRGRGVLVPTLEEVLELDASVRVNIEIKQAQPAMIAALWRFIDDRRVHDRVLVASEQDALVRGFRNLARGSVATSAGKAEIFSFWAAARVGLAGVLPVEFDALQVPVAHNGLRVVERGFVRAAHERGLQVHVWTIDEEAQMNMLMDLGVDAIMTDYPGRLVGRARARGLLPADARQAERVEERAP
ncbi:glycerophosphodiester phosphodiesterase [Pseudenhygromyxa sp. WMMC2535]|uniref:glycerophosphodiester phosphodiesterase n=1 Tax=Pseudenhygromyxa sp. WMMC2535 TaxID=2712867 RepID=UPI001596326C|nr:glycerophosphodiester phosphodiesterase [Pseudenhygromyxa sp. WMMC2535]NVB40402.1 glycerophosphodiester phosphodiesterase [Pseudenhygromyxa sp. WMMC2535]